MKFVNNSEVSTTAIAAQRGLVSNTKELVKSERTWADVVKSRRCETNKESIAHMLEQQFPPSDTDEETQANSSTFESDTSDSESSVGNWPASESEAGAPELNSCDLIQSEQQIVSETCQTAIASINPEKSTRLRRHAPLFVPVGMSATTAVIKL